MDPVTHGIAGALIGKAFFAKRPSSNRSNESAPRIAVLAATLGAVFPDVDVFADAFSRDPLGIARYHRGFTHSFVGLPIFAAALAWLTRAFVRWYAKRTHRDDLHCPSFYVLFMIYAAGIASHIILDGFTSFGTRMLNPFSKDRVAWDFLFIIDFVFTALILLPQLAAWVHQRRETAISRAAEMWGFCTVLAVGSWSLARAAEFPFSIWIVVAASAVFAALFFFPILNDWGSRVRRSAWCRAGFYVVCAYIIACGVAHQVAISHVHAFAATHGLAVEKIGALPLPPSFLDWNGMVLTPGGVYQSSFSLRDAGPPNFRLIPDSPPNRFAEEAARLEPVQTYLWFARFPVTRFMRTSNENIVEYADPRFFEGNARNGPMPFTFAVIFDSQGKLLHYGWVRARVVARVKPSESVAPPDISEHPR
ncbi:MAG TPA: metal-dependent hydrolase [Candidatus Acidoferrales bacterium]|nr:metal-dependent hydrolase [Candidatus Acidoferrales bacterium]